MILCLSMVNPLAHIFLQGVNFNKCYTLENEKCTAVAQEDTGRTGTA